MLHLHFISHLQSDTHISISNSSSHTSRPTLSKMEPPAIKVNSEMYDFKLRYFLAAEEWQQRGWVHPAGVFELPDCLTNFTPCRSRCTEGRAEQWQQCLAPGDSHNASHSSRPTAGRKVEGSLYVGHVRHTHRSVPAGRWIHRHLKNDKSQGKMDSKWVEGEDVMYKW